MNRNVVLVHGGFVDGSGWLGVHRLLTADGFTVKIVQNPTLSLAEDAAATRFILDGLDGPAVLVGHSYGGAVISEAGTHEAVAALVYIAAFAPDKGESVNTLIADPPRAHRSRRSCRRAMGSCSWTATSSTTRSPATCRPTRQRSSPTHRSRGASSALAGTVTEPAWRAKPAWYLVSTQDRMIPPPAQRAMAARAGATTVEAIGSHAIYASQPGAVADLIRQAAASADR